MIQEHTIIIVRQSQSRVRGEGLPGVLVRAPVDAGVLGSVMAGWQLANEEMGCFCLGPDEA